MQELLSILQQRQARRLYFPDRHRVGYEQDEDRVGQPGE
jgi:hypothetical protein